MSDALYGGVVLEHFRRPRNQRTLATPSAVHEAYNPLCGDRVRVEVLVESGTITEVAFTANACAICTASASLMTERASGAPVHDALALTDADLIAALGADLPDTRVPCATLPMRALHAALAEAASRSRE